MMYCDNMLIKRVIIIYREPCGQVYIHYSNAAPFTFERKFVNLIIVFIGQFTLFSQLFDIFLWINVFYRNFCISMTVFSGFEIKHRCKDSGWLLQNTQLSRNHS